jgi:hypothetical protein
MVVLLRGVTLVLIPDPRNRRRRRTANLAEIRTDPLVAFCRPPERDGRPRG